MTGHKLLWHILDVIYISPARYSVLGLDIKCQFGIPTASIPHLIWTRAFPSISNIQFKWSDIIFQRNLFSVGNKNESTQPYRCHFLGMVILKLISWKVVTTFWKGADLGIVVSSSGWPDKTSTMWKPVICGSESKRICRANRKTNITLLMLGSGHTPKFSFDHCLSNYQYHVLMSIIARLGFPDQQ